MDTETNVELHDDENDIVDEAHDMKNAEIQSIDSVSKAGRTTKKMPARRGDKYNTEPMQKAPDEKVTGPKSKIVMANDMYNKMSKMTKEELEVIYDGLMGESFESDEGEEDYVEREVELHVDFKEDLDALVDSEATLSEEFKEKTAVIFEAALKSKLSEEIDRLEENYQTQLQEETTRIRDEVVESVDSYLNYVVENWMEENSLAIQQGLRTEIAEDFMNKLKDVFEESYIHVPESKVDLVDELADQVEELEESLNETTVRFIEITEELDTYKREFVIREHCSDLAETQVEKLRGLVESVDFDDEESFAKKVLTIKESYFSNKKVVNEGMFEEETDNGEIVENSSVMNSYLSAIRKTQK